ncbi:MAG: hypothetical protein ABIP50_00045 [Candidatus Saccharimonadales bacterium]
MLQRVIALITVASLCLLSLMLVFTTPASAGPFGLLVIFISAYLTSLGLMSFFLYGGSRLFAYASSGFTMKKPIQPLSFRRSYYYSTVLAAAPVMLIGLQSVGAVGIYELLLVVVFEVIGCLYVTKRIY